MEAKRMFMHCAEINNKKWPKICKAARQEMTKRQWYDTETVSLLCLK